ncbi:MAG: hypothetical protein PWP38_62 [Clostridiales bacterium]|nr:hypothetical protein [Clostridiales bacterium]
MLDSIFTGSTSVDIALFDVMMTIVIAFAVGGLISGTYRKTQQNGRVSQSFALTMILLPAVIAIIIMLIGSDVAKAFSLAGAFSIIRFRSAPGDPKDIAYVLFAMAAGLAVGVGAYLYAVLFSAVLCLGMYLLSRTRLGGQSEVLRQLQITVPEDLDFENAFDDILKNYTTQYALKRVKTTNMGSLYQLTYDVALIENTSTKALIDALRCRNGNLNISLMLAAEQASFS